MQHTNGVLSITTKSNCIIENVSWVSNMKKNGKVLPNVVLRFRREKFQRKSF